MAISDWWKKTPEEQMSITKPYANAGMAGSLQNAGMAGSLQYGTCGEGAGEGDAQMTLDTALQLMGWIGFAVGFIFGVLIGKILWGGK